MRATGSKVPSIQFFYILHFAPAIAVPSRGTQGEHMGLGRLTMKKLDQFFARLDKKIDRRFSGFYLFFKKYFIVFSSTVLALMLIISLFKVYYNKPYFTASLIGNDVKIVHDALHSIDKRCNILRFNNRRVILDFFTVSSFDGSVIGGVSLAYPKKWTKAVLHRNPIIQQKFYEVVRAQDGFFVVPGEGVTLPTGLVMGKDVVIKRQTQVGPMIRPDGKLFFKGIKLAKRLQFKIGDWDPVIQLNQETIEDINSILKEFNEAMPFTENSSCKSYTQNDVDILKV